MSGGPAPYPVDVPTTSALPGGLYSAATLIDVFDDRHLGGLDALFPYGKAHGVVDDVCAPGVLPGLDTAYSRELGPGFTVWSAAECATPGVIVDEQEAQAEAALRVTEPRDVENAVATYLGASPSSEVMDPVTAIANLDEALSATGVTGVIHGRAGLAAVLKAAGMLVRVGSQWLSPGGHRFALGGGYKALGDVLVGTGPVVVRRGPVTVSDAVQLRRNRQVSVAHRTVAVAAGQPRVAVTVKGGA